MKLGDTIYVYRVEHNDGSGIINDEKRDEFTCTEHKIIGLNKRLLVIDNERFTTIKHIGKPEKVNVYSYLNDVGVSTYRNDSCFGNAIMAHLYADSKVRPSYIRRKIEAHIRKEYGYFMKGVDLSFIK